MVMEVKSNLMAKYSNNNSFRQQKLIQGQNLRKGNETAFLKQIFPNYIYSPPYGFPKRLNGVFLRAISKNLHISSILKTVKDAIILTEWEIAPKRGIKLNEEQEAERLKCEELFKNPNPEDTYGSWMRKIIEDLIVLEAGTYQNVLNLKGEISQLRAIDGNSILKNPDVFGSFQNRDKIIWDWHYFVQDIQNDWKLAQSKFNDAFNLRSAYFQYDGSMVYGFPTPYGKDEVVYIQMNPESNGVYTNGSPISDSIDVIVALIMGVKYHLDFYLNGNTPEGIINVAGGTTDDVERVKTQLENSFKTVEESIGFERRMGYVAPITNADGVQFVPLTFNARDMEILGQQTLLNKLLWQRLGLTADEMGYTDDSNRATSTQQTDNSIRKAVFPYLKELADNFNKYTIQKFFKFGDLFEFKFRFDDNHLQKIKLDVYEQKVRLGIETWQTIAEREGIDIEELKKFKEENKESMIQENSLNSNKEDEFEGEGDYQKKEEIKSKIEDINKIIETNDIVQAINNELAKFDENQKLKDSNEEEK